MNRNGTPTENDWTMFAIMFGDTAARASRAHYNRRLRAMRVRIALAVATFLVSAAIAVLAIWFVILILVFAYDAVVGL